MAQPNPLEQVPLERLRERTSIKWHRYDPDVLPLWVAEMDVDLAPPIAGALERAVRTGDTGYPGSTPFVEAFTEFAAARWQWPTLDAALVRPVAGVIPGYTDALLLAAGHGGYVVITSPVYPPFYSYLREAGLTVVEAVLTDEMRLDPDTLEATLAQARRDTSAGVAVLLCNPHNPGGTVHTRDELEQLATIAHGHGATVVSDEIHAPLVYAPAEFIPYLAVDGSGIALHSASKAWNLAAMPGALMVFGHEAADAHRTFAAGAHHWPGHFAVIAQTAAYSEGGPWLEAVLKGLDSNRHLLGSLLAEHLPAVGYRVPEATYLAWLDCTALGLDGDPAAVFLKRGRVALNSGPTFGTGGAGHARLNFATSGAILEEAVRRMAAAL
ncbi:aminotransferase class I/II-fold pyridoxal phosphate-dependent enzyme [Demequina sp.]|uniref:MalY/PatB family protein n=1 Tax=Demequina sp. TaxID=2050685 RepID=UPI0025BFAA98|nr:aminotransferase class I/II-fold pyridoxal phosphate-dependent enzyme [Demequina sp.]